MKISDLDFHLVEVPRTAPLGPLRRLLIRVATFRGVEGWGEAAVPWRSDELSGRRAALLPTLADRSIYDIEELIRLDGVAPPALASGLEMALWDVVGRTLGQPACNFWGGLYRKRVPLAVDVIADSREKTVTLARELSEQGFHTQMLPATGNVDDDVATLAAVIEAAGDRTAFRLDGRCRFQGDEARELCRRLEGTDIQFLLDPLADADLLAVASLRRETNVPLAISQGIVGPADVLSIVKTGAARQVVLRLERVGGLASLRRCVAVAEAAEATPLVDARDGLGLATAAMAHLAAATPALANANPTGYHQLQDDVLSEPLELADGLVVVPQGPGLGVDVDRAKIDRYLVT